MIRKTRFSQHPLFFASPWILAAAIGILLLIVIFFTVNNLQREKRLITENLFHKGLAVMRLVGAGTRASMMMGVPSAAQVQHLIEQASGESSILYITVVDADGRILAHSDREQVGERLDHPLITVQEMPPMGRYQILERPTAPHKVFEVASLFRPFQGRGPGFRRRMMPGALSDDGTRLPPAASGDWCQQQLMNNSTAAIGEPAATRFILVGLDMTEEEKVIRQDLYHILFMSLAILLVGIGSWIALLVAQGYRTSQQTLQYMQAFTGLLISRLPVGIIGVNQEGEIKTLNGVAAELTGIRPPAALNQKTRGVLPPLLADFFTLPAAGEEILGREIDFSAPDGRRLILHASSVPVYDQDAAHIGRVLLLQDLTQIKKLEKEVRKHERMVSLGKMAAGVAHEVRNPLSSIKGLATLLGSRFKAESEEHQSATLLIKEVERLNRTISELLNYARPLPLHRHPLVLHDFIGNSLKLIENDAHAQGVTLVPQVASGVPDIMADGDRLNQVLLNLYLNSLQAMEQGGTLTVTARQGEKENTVEIVVQDSGSGIPAENLDRIMDPYFTTKPQGTGLGLAMVHKIIDEHHGGVRVASHVGHGTTVTLTLPLA